MYIYNASWDISLHSSYLPTSLTFHCCFHSRSFIYLQYKYFGVQRVRLPAAISLSAHPSQCLSHLLPLLVCLLKRARRKALCTLKDIDCRSLEMILYILTLPINQPITDNCNFKNYKSFVLCWQEADYSHSSVCVKRTMIDSGCITDRTDRGLALLQRNKV